MCPNGKETPGSFIQKLFQPCGRSSRFSSVNNKTVLSDNDTWTKIERKVQMTPAIQLMRQHDSKKATNENVYGTEVTTTLILLKILQ